MNWIPKVRALLEQGRESHKAAAEVIIAAMLEHNLNQKEAGAALGKSPTFVCRLLQWHKGGCNGFVFAPEARKRRAIASSQLYSAPKQTGQLELNLSKFGCPSDNYRSGQREANLRAAALELLCAETARRADALGCPEVLELVFASATPAERRHGLRALSKKVKKAATNLSALVHEIGAELKRISSAEEAHSPQPATQTLEPVLLQ